MTETQRDDGRIRADSVWTYDEIAQRVDHVRKFFAQQRITIHPNSTLSVLLRDAQVLAQDWATDPTRGDIKKLIAGAHANRIADAVIAVMHDPNARESLRRIAANNVNLLEREASQGKDALWELELLAKLKGKSIEARIAEPDIVIDMNGSEYSIACKKIYSESGTKEQVKRGVKQIKRSGRPGIVALNIDDLVPANSLLNAKTLKQANEFLYSFNRRFIDRQKAAIRNYITAGRCDGLLVSTSCPSDIAAVSPRFNNHSQTVLWPSESLTGTAYARLKAFADQLGAAY